MSLLFKAPFTSQPQGAVELAGNLSIKVTDLFIGSSPFLKSSEARVTYLSAAFGVDHIGCTASTSSAASKIVLRSGAPAESAPFTVIAVLKRNGALVSWRRVLSLASDEASAGIAWQLLEHADGTLYASYFRGGTEYNTYALNSGLSSTAYRTVILTHDGVSFRQYIDGKLINTVSIGGYSALSGLALNVGDIGVSSVSAGATVSTPLVVRANGVPTSQELKSLSDNPWQLFKPQSRSLWIPSTVSTPAGHTLTAATTAQSSSSGTGSITQSHTLSGSATSQSATSGTGAITHGTTHVLTVATSTQSSTASAGSVTQTHLITGTGASQSSTSTTGAVTQGHALTGAASSQSAGSSTGAVIAGFVHILAGATSSQSAASSTGAVTQSHVLVCAPSVQDSIASASSIVQAHVLAAGGCSQLAVSGVGAIWDGVALPFDPSIYVATSPVVSYLANSPAQSYSVTAPAKNYSA